MLVQALIPQSTVERFDVGVLVRLAGLDQPQRDPATMRPVQHGAADELWAVVGADDRGRTPLGTDTVEDPNQVIATDRVLGHDRDRLVGRVVHHDQALERTTGGDPVEHEVHGPDLVGGAWPDQRLAFRHRDLLAPATPDMQLLEPVQPFDPLVVHNLSGLPQLEMDHPDSVTTVPLRQGDDARP